MEKTNVMRILDSKKLSYNTHFYKGTGETTGEEIANELGEAPEQVFKTLVTQGKSKKYYVFMVPVCETLDLKKAAKVCGEKSIDMVKSKELLPLTGYVHGGCSPVGMKKQFSTFAHLTVENFEKIFFSGGKIGCQVEMAFADLQKVLPVVAADIVVQT